MTDWKTRLAELDRRRAELYRRSRALKAPRTPDDEVAFCAEVEAIERETAMLDADRKAISGEAVRRLDGLAKA